MTTTPADVARNLEVRDFRFDLSAVPRHWHGAGRSVGLFFDNLSVFFPLGERYFVASVKAFRNQVKDNPSLLKDVDGFCAQEGHHAREHVRYNEWLESLGYPVASMERGVGRTITWAQKTFNKRRQLASTAALEHFTALLARIVLDDPRSLEGAHPTMAALWRWHAAEETEHKAVAHDLFQAIGGPYRERISAMITSTFLFWGRVVVQQVRMMKAAGLLFALDEWWALFRFLWLKPGGMWRVVGPYFHYFKPSFHPNDDDTQDLLDGWRATLEEQADYRNAVNS